MQNKKGFTLIELMIVVAIIAILAMIAVPMYQSYMERARNASAQSLLHQVSLAEAAYSVDNNSQYVYSADSEADNVKTVLESLTKYGFRPDPIVAITILEPTVKNQNGYQAFAANATPGSTVYVYDELTGSGTQAVDTKTKNMPEKFSAFKMNVDDTSGAITIVQSYEIETSAASATSLAKVKTSTKK